MGYIKSGIVLFFLLSLLFAPVFFAVWAEAAKVCWIISAAFFLLYIFLRFILKYPDDSRFSRIIDAPAIVCGAFAVVLVIVMLA